MPYRIYARSTTTGAKVTRLDLDPNSRPIRDEREARVTAEAFAETRGHGGPWEPLIEYYKDEDRTANPNWDRNGGRTK